MSPPMDSEPVARDVMHQVGATAVPSTLVGEAHRLLREHAMTHLPVLDGDLLVGIVSQRDLLRAESDAWAVRRVMQPTVFVIAPQTPVGRVARIFRERRLPILLVLDGRRLVGIVRAVDVLETAWDRAKA